MKRKGILFVLIILFVGCLAAGSIGYFQSKQDKEPDTPTPVGPSIKYVYYLEEIEVSKDEITNDSDNISGISTQSKVKYVFTSSSCTNGVTGDFDTDTWEFIPSEIKESTCKLYFNKSYYDVTLTITNGELATGTETTVEREKNGVFAINPYEGYEFDTYTCSNNKEAAWDKVNNKLTISAIMEDVACKVVFKIRTLKMDLTVTNGTGTTTETVEYGKSVTSVIAPNTGFENPTVKCTNDQEAKYSNNTITIEKLTNDTVCTVTYTAVKVEEYTLLILELPFTLRITSGSTSQQVKKGDDGKFTITPNTGFEVDTVTCYKTGDKNETVVPSLQRNNDKTVVATLGGMTKNITCEVTAKES